MKIVNGNWNGATNFRYIPQHTDVSVHRISLCCTHTQKKKSICFDLWMRKKSAHYFHIFKHSKWIRMCFNGTILMLLLLMMIVTVFADSVMIHLWHAELKRYSDVFSLFLSSLFKHIAQFLSFLFLSDVRSMEMILFSSSLFSLRIWISQKKIANRHEKSFGNFIIWFSLNQP